MWARKRLDIGWGDLAFGSVRCAWPTAPSLTDEEIAGSWIPAHESLVCLSVRSGLDLLLSALELPPGSEVLLSAINIPDIARIIERHGLHAVPVEVDPETFHPFSQAVEEAVSPQTRMIVVAHLFGRRSDLGQIATVARRRDVFLVEDCAQAFAGREYGGHPAADASLFSFGPIKAATALGGAVLRIKEPALRNRMRQLQQQYPRARRLRYFGRILKYSGLKLLASRPVYGGLVRAIRLFGINHDRFLHGRLRSFGGKTDLLSAIRWQPSEPMKWMLRRRIAQFGENDLTVRQARARRLADNLARHGLPPVLFEPSDTFWVFPCRSQNPEGLAKWLFAHGFDVARQSSLVAVRPSDPDRAIPHLAQRVLESLVFLPAYAEMPEHEIDRLADLVAQFEAPQAIPASAATDSAAGKELGVVPGSSVRPRSC